VEKLDSRFGAVSELLGPDASPDSSLAAYDDLATLLGVHVVLWIEDLERFQGSSQGQSDTTSIVRALLNQLQRFHRMTVVLASADLGTRVDMQKIARFVEHTPRMETPAVTQLIAELLQGCRSLRPADIDPASRKAREELATGRGVEEADLIVRFLGRDAGLQGALVHLCSTPRILKSALRDALAVWDRLAGDIDLDDVLAMCVVRAARPDVFAIVDDHIRLLQHGPPDDRDDAPDPVKVAIDRVCSEHPRTREALDRVLDFVFPARSDRTAAGKAEKPQGLSIQDEHRDQWRLFLSLPSLTDHDQPVLHAIAHWNASSSSELVQIMLNPARAKIARRYGRSIDPKRLPVLIPAVAEAGLRIPFPEWPEGDPPGISAIWLIAQTARRAGQGDAEALARALEVTASSTGPKNFGVLHELLHDFSTPDQSVAPLITDAARGRLLALTDGILRAFTGRPERLIAALTGTRRYTLLWVCWRLERVRSKAHLSGDVPFEGWDRFAETVLAAAFAWPSLMIPQILPFFVNQEDNWWVDEASPRSRRSFVFHEQVATRLFGIEPLAELLGKSFITLEP
jgi:hypothetical protein